jgi:serine/threonine-protein kinase
MNPDPSMLPEPDERLGEILAAWIEAAEQGHAPDSAEWLARHAEFAPELQEFLVNRERLQATAEPLCQAVRGMAAVAPSSGATPLPMSQISTDVLPATGMIGRSVGDYDLLAEIGQGGMGLVYTARHRRLQRVVALKMLRTNVLSEAGDVQRFRNEAEVLAQLDHPHIVPVHDIGEHEGRVYFSMKLIEGGGLDRQLIRFTNDPRAAARLVAQVARAVHHAHQRGILHRDLKPSNILLNREGQPHVSDFGLAKRIEADGSLTQTGAIVGTPQYMAPEQTSGCKGAVTTATDVYGLGAVLYALLTGRPPFRGETVLETLEQVRDLDPEPPSKSNPRIDRELEAVCLKCLHKDPMRRYASAEDLAEDLERWLRGEPVVAQRPSPAQWAIKWCKRRLAAVVIAAVVSFVVAIGLSVAVALIWQANAQKAALLIDKDTALTEKDQALIETGAARDRAKSYFQDSLKIVSATNSKNTNAMNRLQLNEASGSLRSTAALAEKCAADYPDEADVCRILMMTHDRLSSCQKELCNFVGAVESQQRAVAACRRWASAFPEDKIASQTGPYLLATQLWSLGERLQQTGQFQEAEQAYGEAQALWEQLEKVQPSEDENWILTRRIEYANALGNLRLETGRLPEARQAFDRAMTLIRRKLSDDAPAIDRKQTDFWLPRSRIRIGLGKVFLEEGHPEQAARTFRLALQDLERLTKGIPGVVFYDSPLDMAWLLVTCPVKEIQDPARAVALASETIEVISRDYPYSHWFARAWKVRAVAHYRTGDWEAATQALDRLEVHRPPDGTVQFVRSMVTWQQGKRRSKEIARKIYDDSVRWMETNQPSSLELRRFRSEAAELLGIQTPRAKGPVCLGKLGDK